MRLIWVDAKAEYFYAEGLTRFLKIRSDLPEGGFVADPAQDLRLHGKQIKSAPAAGPQGGQSGSVPTIAKEILDSGGMAQRVAPQRTSPTSNLPI